jgi:hypothetical protein
MSEYNGCYRFLQGVEFFRAGFNVDFVSFCININGFNISNCLPEQFLVLSSEFVNLSTRGFVIPIKWISFFMLFWYSKIMFINKVPFLILLLLDPILKPPLDVILRVFPLSMIYQI